MVTLQWQSAIVTVRARDWAAELPRRLAAEGATVMCTPMPRIRREYPDSLQAPQSGRSTISPTHRELTKVTSKPFDRFVVIDIPSNNPGSAISVRTRLFIAIIPLIFRNDSSKSTLRHPTLLSSGSCRVCAMQKEAGRIITSPRGFAKIATPKWWSLLTTQPP